MKKLVRRMFFVVFAALFALSASAQTPGPTCTLTANPAVITTGQCSTISWATFNSIVPGISIDNGIGVIVGQSGSLPICPVVTTTYTGTMPLGTQTCSVTVTVAPTPPPVATRLAGNRVFQFDWGNIVVHGDAGGGFNNFQVTASVAPGEIQSDGREWYCGREGNINDWPQGSNVCIIYNPRTQSGEAYLTLFRNTVGARQAYYQFTCKFLTSPDGNVWSGGEIGELHPRGDEAIDEEYYGPCAGFPGAYGKGLPSSNTVTQEHHIHP